MLRYNLQPQSRHQLTLVTTTINPSLLQAFTSSVSAQRMPLYAAQKFTKIKGWLITQERIRYEAFPIAQGFDIRQRICHIDVETRPNL